MFELIPLSSLSAGRRNPRRVKPEQDAHRRLVASIRSVGLISPLCVAPIPDDPERYRVIAGKRRLKALRTIYRGCTEDPKIKCEVLDVDAATADAVSLAENFAREGMHPLDEAEAFAKLAHVEAKGVGAVAAEFGVSPRYVRQRIKLAGLADELKAAYRENDIDTATAEVFAGVPAVRQMEVWREVDGRIAHAHHAKNLIESRWIDAKLARFDVSSLPENAVSRDLFHERVLCERNAFLQAQAEALEQEREALLDEGWAEVVVAERNEVFDRLHAMAPAEGSYDEQTQLILDDLDTQRDNLVRQAEDCDADEDDGRYEALCEQIDKLDEREAEIVESAVTSFDEATKAHATVFLLVDSEGRVHREARMPRTSRNSSSTANGVALDTPRPLPTPDDLSDRQKAAVWVFETLAVRQALMQDAKRRRVLLAMILHPTVRSDGMAVRTESDSLTRYVEAHRTDDAPHFASAAWDDLDARRALVDPFREASWVEPLEAYETLLQLPADQLEELIDLLTVQALVGSLNHHDPLSVRLSADLGLELRTVDGEAAQGWKPDTEWLKGYKKIQLAGLMGELRGPAYGSAAEKMKKSELVAILAGLFADGAANTLPFPDEALVDRLNRWTPSCVRQENRGVDEEPSEVDEVVAAA